MWDDETFIDDNTLNVYMARLRKKLLSLSIMDPIQTIPTSEIFPE
ncbi:winged helix-turn-helix domain-containing protein [Paenibacillus zeirhizosphaerae]